MGKIKKKKKIIRKPIGWLGRPSTIYKTEIEKIFLIPFLFLLIIPFSLGQITIGNNNENLPKVEVGMSEGTGNYYYNITNLTQFINTFDQDLNTTNDVIFNTVHANNLCYSNGTNCIVTDLSSAGGWTNDSISTNTSLDVIINNSLIVKNTTGINLFSVNTTQNNVTIISDSGRQFTVQDSAGHIYFRTGSSANTFGYAGATTVNAGNSLLTLAGYTGTDFSVQNKVRMKLTTAGLNITDTDFIVNNGSVTLGYTNVSGGNRNGQINVNSIYSSTKYTGTLSYNPSGTLWQMSGNLGVSGGGVRPTYSNTNLDFNTLTSGATTSSNILFRTNNTERMRVTVDGNVTIQNDLNVSRNVNIASNLTAINGNFTGNISAGGLQGLTTNKLINGSTSQCWLNYTSGLLTASDC